MASQASDAGRLTRKEVHPQRNPSIGPHASRRKTYCPPVAGIIAPSSAYASAPKNERTPVKIQIAMIHVAEGNCCATTFGTRKIPAPMMVPTTIAVESHSPSLRGRSLLSLNPARAAPLHEIPRAPVEVAGDRVLQATRRDREFQRLLMRGERQQSINQPAGEAIASTYAIHNLGDIVMPAEQKFLAIVEARRPAVV